MKVSKDLLDAVIIGHRELIADRYDYHNLTSKYHLPDWIKEKDTENLRSYFLDFIYPSLEKRAELDDAFRSLEGHISNPQHLMVIFLDSGRLLFKYGRYLPKILGAGLKAMGSFRLASKVEYSIAEAADSHDQKPPFSVTDIHHLITKIPRKHLDDLLDNVSELYKVLNNENLVNKIIEVVDHLLGKMKARPNVYSTEEISGIELGREIIVGSKELFYQFPESQRADLVQFIIDVEKDAVEEAYM